MTHNKSNNSVISHQSSVISSAAKRQEGVTLAFSLIILSNMLFIALAIGIFSINQLKITASARDSAYAIFAATSGLERAFYQVRKADDCSDINFPQTDFSNLAPNLSYSVDVTATCPTPASAIITSVGTYKQTSRKIEASW